MSSLRAKISAAAQELYRNEGIEAVSMRRVAEMVGISAPAIYRHFKNKETLLNEIVVEGLKILEGYLRPSLETGTPYERLIRMSEAYLTFALEQPKYFDFAFLVPNPSLGGVADEIARPDWATFRLCVEQVAACMAEGVLAQDDPLETSITIWAEVHGLVTLYRTGRFGQDPEAFRAIYRQSVERMMRGLAAAHRPATRPRSSRS